MVITLHSSAQKLSRQVKHPGHFSIEIHPFAWSIFGRRQQAVAIPGLLSGVWGFLSREALYADLRLVTVSLAFTTASALWPASLLTGCLDADAGNVHALAFFPLLYLTTQRGRDPDPCFCFAMTFWTLLYADLVASFARAYQGLLPSVRYFVGIGGAGLGDGLVLFPLLGALAAWLAVKRNRSVHAMEKAFSRPGL